MVGEENKFPVKPTVIAAGLLFACLWLIVRQPTDGINSIQWMGLGLSVIMASHWPLRNRSMLFMISVSTLLWFLLARTIGGLQAEMMVTVGRSVWPAAWGELSLLQSGWLLAGFPWVLALNLDIRAGGKDLVLTKQWLPVGFAFGPVVAGVVPFEGWLNYAALWTSLAAVGAMGAGERFSMVRAWWGLALFYPMALIIQALPLDGDMLIWARRVLLVSVLAWSVVPGERGRRGILVLAAAGLALAGMALADKFWPKGTASAALAAMLIVGAPCYGEGWKQILVLLLLILFSMVISKAGIWIASPAFLQGIGVPLLVFALLYSDPQSRRWT